MASEGAVTEVSDARGLEQTDEDDGFDDGAGDERAGVEIAEGGLRGEKRDHRDNRCAEGCVFRPPREQAERGGEAERGGQGDRGLFVNGARAFEQEHVDPDEERMERAEKLHAHRDQNPVATGEKLLFVSGATLRFAESNEGFGRKHGGRDQALRGASLEPASWRNAQTRANAARSFAGTERRSSAESSK